MDSRPCFRYDVSQISDYQITEEGYLKVRARIARTGIQSYTDASGGIRLEYRPEEEVASSEALDSFREKCLTKEHPPVLLMRPTPKTMQLVLPAQMSRIPMALLSPL